MHELAANMRDLKVKLALFCTDNNFQTLHSLLLQVKPSIEVVHTTDISALYEHLFSGSECGFSMVVFDSKLYDLRAKNFQSSVQTYLKSVDCVLLSGELVEVDSPLNSFDLSELGKRRFLEFVKSKRINELKNSQSLREKGEEKEIEWLLKKYERVVNGAGEAIVGVDENGKITFLNRFACELFDMHESDLLGKSLSDFALDSPLNRGTAARSFSGESENARRVGRGTVVKPDGSFIYVEYTQSYVGNDDDGTVSVMVIEDIGDRIKFESKLKTLANKDMLTGLSNRYAIQRALELEIANRRSGSDFCTAVLIDLDGFKHVNDTYGHTTGDKLLITLAKRMKDSVRRGDLAGRLGGDEFMILLKNTDSYIPVQTVKKLLEKLKKPIVIDERSFEISASAGVCHSAYWGENFNSTLEYLDQALYAVKASGKDGLKLYDEMTEKRDDLKTV